MTKKTKILLAGGIAGATSLIGVFLVLWFALWMPPTKADYAAAKSDADKILTFKSSTRVNEFIKVVNTQYTNGETGKALLDSVAVEHQNAIEAANNRGEFAAQVGKSKALRDPEVKKAFDTYAPIEARYGKYIHNYTDEYVKYMSSAAVCGKVYRGFDSKDRTLKAIAKTNAERVKVCKAELTILDNSPMPPFASYAKEFKEVVTERQSILDKVANRTMKSSAAVPLIAANNKRYKEIWPHEEMKKYRETQILHGELQKLIDLLDKKTKSA